MICATPIRCLIVSYNAITEGFGIYLINKKYVLKEPPKSFYDKLRKIVKTSNKNSIVSELKNVYRNFKETRSLKELKQTNNIAVFPEKLTTIKNVLKRKDYLSSQKYFQKKNVTYINENPKTFYKRIFKISELKYNFKWFVIYYGIANKKKSQYFWTDTWKFFLKIK